MQGIVIPLNDLIDQYMPNLKKQLGMLGIFLGDSGILNVCLEMFGMDPIPFMSSGGMFRSVYTWSGAWQGLGFGSVIYIAALAGVDMQLHEAAIVDGASIWQRIWHIDLIEIRPTILVLFIMGLGNVINVGYEKVLLMQNPLNIATSEVLSTYTYKVGLIVSTVPLMLIYPFIQKHFVKGILIGAVKG